MPGGVDTAGAEADAANVADVLSEADRRRLAAAARRRDDAERTLERRRHELAVRVADAHRRGATVVELADALGVSRMTVYEHLRRASAAPPHE